MLENNDRPISIRKKVKLSLSDFDDKINGISAGKGVTLFK